MKSIYAIMFAGLALLAMSSCSDTTEMTPYELTTKTEFGKRMIESGVVGSVHTDSMTTVADGVRELYIHFLSLDGYATRAYVYEVDMNKTDIDIKVCTANNYNTTAFSKQPLSEQALFVEAEGNTVLGGINGDYFVASGRPKGILVKDGKVIKKYSRKAELPYFGIEKNKKAVIGSEIDLRENGMENLRDAVGGRDWLVQGGNVMPQVVPIREAKTAVGLTADGRVIMFVVDGGLFYYSNGLLLADVAKIMMHLGCTESISLSSGASSTFLSRITGKIALRNIPSNNMIEDAVSNGLLIIKK